MLNDAEELENYERKQFPNPPYIQRSVSAPAIAEHVADAILPVYPYSNDQDAIAANGNRMNPRMEYFDENQTGETGKASLLSLINDTINRTPMDLIQHDFPSTPSSVYSKRIFDPELKDAELKVPPLTEATTGSTAQAPRSLNLLGGSAANNTTGNADATANALEQTTKSLEKLYVNPQDLSPKSMTGAPAAKPLLSQYVPPAGSILSSVQSDLAFNNNSSGKAYPSNKPTSAGQSPYNTLLGNNPSAILNNGLNPLAPSVAMGGMLGNPAQGGAQTPAQGAQQAGQPQQQPSPQHPPQQQPQPAYFVQQAVYLDANGQPLFYRPMNSQYPQEFMYATGPDGTPHMQPIPAGMNASDLQGQMPPPAYIPYAAGVAQMNQAGFWTTNPNDQSGMPIFVPSSPQGMPGIPVMGGPHEPRRMVFNPATGQYNSIPASSMAGARGINPGQAGFMGHGLPYGPGMQMPALLPRGAIGGLEHDMHGGYGGDYRDHRRDRDRDYGRRDDRDLRRDHRGDRHHDRDGRGGRNGSSAAGVNPVRDSLVDEFRNTYGKNRQWGLRDLLGHVVAFCQDQHGSRFIQQRLEVCTDVDKQLIFDEIIPAAQGLITDVFGNYVLQKLFEYGTPDQCESLAILLKGQAVQLSMQMYGCRVVQKALEYVGTPRLIELVQEFESPPLLIRCVHDSNGNHVIQKCIEIVSKAAKEAPSADVSDYLAGRIQFIIEAFRGKVKELSSHPYGCRVVQRILEHCTNAQKAVILEELRQCCTELVQDCYGNYVIQFVMQHGWEADRAVLIREVQNNLLDFSQHKFASNVVEKCLQYASKKDRDEMIWTIINVTFDLKNPVDSKGHCVLESMVRDPYANYVVQKVIDVSDDRQRAAIMRYVKENITQLRRYTYGKHIIVRLEKITNEKF